MNIKATSLLGRTGPLLPESAVNEPLKTVLLVDDDGKLLRGLERSFADEDYQLITAVSAAEAKACLAKFSVDLILSDNLMPGVLGTQFLAEVRQEYPHVKLLMLSGYMPAAAAQRAMAEIGVLQVLNKPCKASEVAAAIRQALGSFAKPSGATGK